jgi:hypothetical protein
MLDAEYHLLLVQASQNAGYNLKLIIFCACRLLLRPLIWVCSKISPEVERWALLRELEMIRHLSIYL